MCYILLEQQKNLIFSGSFSSLYFRFHLLPVSSGKANSFACYHKSSKKISLFYFDEFVGGGGGDIVVFVIGVALPANKVLLTSIVGIVMFFPISPVVLLVVLVTDAFGDGLVCAKIDCRSPTRYVKIISPMTKDTANTMELFTIINIVDVRK
jgi:hypothetical protein